MSKPKKGHKLILDEIIECPICGKTFNQLKDLRRKYCSDKCYRVNYLQRRRVDQKRRYDRGETYDQLHPMKAKLKKQIWWEQNKDRINKNRRKRLSENNRSDEK